MDMPHEEQQARAEKDFMRVLRRPPKSELASQQWVGSDGGGEGWHTWYQQFSAKLLEWWHNTAEPGKRTAWACVADRMACDLLEYRDPKAGKQTIPFAIQSNTGI